MRNLDLLRHPLFSETWWRSAGVVPASAPNIVDTHLLAAVVVQVIVGAAATIPFARRRNARTALFALALWLAGAVTVAGQPIRLTDGRIAGALNGSANALLLYDVLVVAWGMSGSLLYISHMRPIEDVEGLRTMSRRLLFLHVVVLAVLAALLPFAIDDPWVRREGAWFPVANGMAPGPFIYGLVGHIYILAMFAWAAFGCWQASRVLTRSTVRFGTLCGCCLVCAITAQSVAVSIAQLRHQEYFATSTGQLTRNLWLLFGFLLPLVALFTAGIVRRWHLFWLARDLRALARRLVADLSSAAPDRRHIVAAWSELVSAGRLPLGRVHLGSASPLRRMHLFAMPGLTFVRALVESAVPVIRDPVADVDRFAILVRDLLDAAYPMPGAAALLAAVWLRTQPTELTASVRERDVAMLLLAATIIGGEHGVFEHIPLDYPIPLTQLFEDDRSWEYPASARFLQATWRALQGRRDRSVHDVIRQGLSELRHILATATAPERDAMVLAAFDVMGPETVWWSLSSSGTNAPLSLPDSAIDRSLSRMRLGLWNH